MNSSLRQFLSRHSSIPSARFFRNPAARSSLNPHPVKKTCCLPPRFSSHPPLSRPLFAFLFSLFTAPPLLSSLVTRHCAAPRAAPTARAASSGCADTPTPRSSTRTKCTCPPARGDASPSDCADIPTRNSSTRTTRTAPRPPGARVSSSDCADTQTRNSSTRNACIDSPSLAPFVFFKCPSHSGRSRRIRQSPAILALRHSSLPSARFFHNFAALTSTASSIPGNFPGRFGGFR